MKVKTSITLSEELMEAIDGVLANYNNRSTFLETAAWSYLKQLEKDRRDARDIEILDEMAEDLNDEIEDILGYQVGL